jgi:hypothetical protein
MHNVRQHHDSATATTVLVSLALASQLDIQPLTAKATLGRATQHGTDSLPPSVMATTKASSSAHNVSDLMRHSVIQETLGVLSEYVKVEGNAGATIRNPSGATLVIELNDGESDETIVFREDATGKLMDFLDLGDDGSFEFDLIHGCLP